MKKTLLSLALLFSLASMNAQNLLSEGFEINYPDLLPTNWTELNLSSPAGTDKWGPGDWFNTFLSQDAGPGYIGVGYAAAGGSGTVSDWLFSPTVNLQNGDVISFYTRTGDGAGGVSTKQYPDRLQMLIGVGATPATPAGATGLGGYTVAVDVNPTYSSTGYPNVWTKYTYTITGISTETPCTIAFRYFLLHGGTSGTQGDYIGLDTLSVDRALGTEQFFLNNFTLQPNPVNDMFRLTSKNEEAIQNIKVIDINGRIVNEVNPSNTDVQMNISNLTAGVYFVKAQSELGVGTYKIVKR